MITLVEEGGLLCGRGALLCRRGVLLYSKMVLYLLGGALAQQRGEKRFSCFVGTRLPFSLLARVNHYSTAYMCVIYYSYYFYSYELSLGFYLNALFARVNRFLSPWLCVTRATTA